jgi:hypothetical protein
MHQLLSGIELNQVNALFSFFTFLYQDQHRFFWQKAQRRLRIYATQHWKTTIVASMVYEHATIVFVFGIFALLGDAAQAS